MNIRQKLILVIITLSVTLFSQNHKGIGASTMYNKQTESFGFELRGSIPIKKRFSLNQEIIYYPTFNKVSELIIGLGLKYNFYNPKYNKKIVYVLTSVAYNAWLNYNSSYMLDAAYHNWNLEFGGGFALKYCFSPFIEYRYNIRWQEATIRMGVTYYFKCLYKNKLKPKKLVKPNRKGKIMH